MSRDLSNIVAAQWPGTQLFPEPHTDPLSISQLPASHLHSGLAFTLLIFWVTRPPVCPDPEMLCVPQLHLPNQASQFQNRAGLAVGITLFVTWAWSPAWHRAVSVLVCSMGS